MIRKVFCIHVYVLVAIIAIAPETRAQQGNDQAPVISPGGERILFRSDRSGDDEIYVMRKDGSQATRLTTREGWDGDAVWSDSGNEIRFVARRSGDLDLFAMRSDGSKPRRIEWINLDRPLHQVAWSTDGNRAAVVMGSFPELDIYLVTRGSEPTQFTNMPGAEHAPSWSPDGRRLAFTSWRGKDSSEGGIFVVNSDGSDASRIVASGPAYMPEMPAWSPDGERIAFQAREDGAFYVSTVGSDGSDRKRISDGSSDDEVPTWSPDGGTVYFQSRRDKEDVWKIYAMNPDGSDRRKISRATTTEKAVLPDKPNVAILVFDGVQIIDFAAPYEVFGQYRLNNVFTVAEHGGTITTNMGMRMEPNYTFDHHPEPDVIVIPGGNIGEQRKNARLREWLEKNAATSQYVLSVCNGAFYLADAGLLDGLEATTYYALLENLQEAAPNSTVVDDRRFADNGKIVTSAGLSSGIDGSLHVISKMHGEAWARVIGLNIEYDWNPQTDFARPLLADMNIPSGVYSVVMPEGRFAAYDGNRDQWMMSWVIPTQESSTTVRDLIDEKLAAEASWNRGAGTFGDWTFTGRDGLSWRGRVDVRPVQDSLIVDFRVERAEVEQ